MKSSRYQSRHGFTLVELLVVMGIMLILAALAVYMLPRMQDNIKVSQAAGQLQGWLLNAKQRAKRDQLPTGLRLIYDTNGLVGWDPQLGANTQTQAIYIQQPEDYAQGRYLGAGVVSSVNNTINPNMARFSGSGLANSLGTGTVNQYPAQFGDYLVVFGGPGRRINSNASTINNVGPQPPYSTSPAFNPAPPYEDLPLDPNTTLLDTSTAIPLPTSGPSPGPNYRIIRAARPLPGEQPLSFPLDTGIDLTLAQSLGFVAVPNTTGFVDVLFSPTGAILNAGAPLYCFRIRDTGGTTPPLAAPTLIAVTTRSGFIAAHPVYPLPDSGVSNVSNVTNPTITTFANHGLFVGQYVWIFGVIGATGVNGGPWGVASIPSPTTFTINTAGPPGVYTSNGIVSAAFDFAIDARDSGL